jgi:hypothetical protein
MQRENIHPLKIENKFEPMSYYYKPYDNGLGMDRCMARAGQATTAA